MTASRSDLLAPARRRYGNAELPISGLSVRYRSLSESEYSQFEMERMQRDDNGRLVTADEPARTTRARLAALCLCDESGERLLSDADVEGLSESLDLADSLFLFGRLQLHCGLIGDFQQIREEAKKNSNGMAANGSPTV